MAMRANGHLLPLCVAWSVGQAAAVAEILHVPDDYPTIQAAIDAASGGDEVVVSPGTYVETIDFLGKAITARSSEGPDVTVIDGNQQGSVVMIVSGEGPDTVLDGFTIIGGTGTSVEDAVQGGGLLVIGASPTIVKCNFNANAAMSELFGCGGGMFIEDGTPTVGGCTFTENMAGFRGGAIYLIDSSLIVTDCSFVSNGTPAINEVGFQTGGGAIMSFESELTLVRCDLRENKSYFGGALCNLRFFGQPSALTIVNCSASNNKGDVGGAVCSQNGTLVVMNSILVANQSTGELGFGGAIHVLSNTLEATNTTIAANVANEGGAMHITDESTATIHNCVLWDNEAPIGSEVLVEGSNGSIASSDVQGGRFVTCEEAPTFIWGEGNIESDPLFVDPLNADYRLAPGSPCVDAGDNASLPIDEFDLDDDGELDESLPIDLDGNQRVEGCRVDMGAYESPTFADCNQNGIADACDIDDETSSDCNLNGVPDECDIAAGKSADLDGNGIPDECEDCNENGVPDALDIADETSLDCNDNGIPDECEADCNRNGIPDECDITDGRSSDCNGNAIPDECDLGSFSTTSGPFAPVEAGYIDTFVVEDGPLAKGDVRITLTALGDLGTDTQFIDVEFMGVPIGTVFVDNGSTCDEGLRADEIVVASDVYNEAMERFGLVFGRLVASDDVGCCSGSFIEVTVSYDDGSNDQNDNGVPDDCDTAGDLNGDGVVDPSDLLVLLGLWGRCPQCDDCVADLDDDCTVGTGDLLILLGNWG